MSEYPTFRNNSYQILGNYRSHHILEIYKNQMIYRKVAKTLRRKGRRGRGLRRTMHRAGVARSFNTEGEWPVVLPTSGVHPRREESAW